MNSRTNYCYKQNTIGVEILFFPERRLDEEELGLPFDDVPALLLTFPLDSDLCKNMMHIWEAT